MSINSNFLLDRLYSWIIWVAMKLGGLIYARCNYTICDDPIAKEKEEKV